MSRVFFHAVPCPSVRARLWQCEAVRLTCDGVGVGLWAPGNALGAEGTAALADPLGKLVHLKSLDLRGTWHGGVECVACVYAWRAVSECAWAAVAVRGCVTDVERMGSGWDQAMGWVPRGQQHWQIRWASWCT